MIQNKQEILYNLLFNRIKIVLNPMLGKSVSKNTIEDIKYRLSNDPIIRQCVASKFDIFQHKEDPMRLKIVDISYSNYTSNSDWKKL